VFALLYAYAALSYLKGSLSKAEFRYVFVLAVGVAAGVVFLVVVGLTWAG
jgi:dolichyl-diphosphooligosaccharide--protein glycosyltransferase